MVKDRGGRVSAGQPHDGVAEPTVDVRDPCTNVMGSGSVWTYLKIAEQGQRMTLEPRARNSGNRQDE